MKYPPSIAIVLAGGLGTRLRSGVLDRPKPMAEVAGRPFLAHLLEYWRRQGITHFVISTGYLGNTISDYFGGSFQGARLTYVRESNPLGTGGGLVYSYSKLRPEQPFLVLNGDTFFSINLKTLHQRALEMRADWCFSLFSSCDIKRYLPLYTLPTGELAFESPSSLINNERSLVNGGVYWVHQRALEPLVDKAKKNLSLEAEVFPFCRKIGQRFFGLEFEAPFIDIGTPEDFRQAQEMRCFSKQKLKQYES